ncbi:hypothetical protein [Nocardiopsis alba]|uniref:hypothetical protein n=1 Tax=Nocardiopsis alba TaxID=53437 RepID=UPI0035D736D2
MLVMVDDGRGGYFPLDHDTTADVEVLPSSATLPRLDAVVAEVVDNGDETSLFRIRTVAGTPAATPSLPALPPDDQPTAHVVLLATVLVRAQAESTGRVRPQDVEWVAPSARSGRGPWNRLSLTSGLRAHPNFGSPPSWRMISPTEVALVGTVSRSDGDPITTGAVLAMMPAAIRPPQTKYHVAGSSSTTVRSSVRLQVSGATGELAANFGNDYMPGWIALDGFRYDLDV